MALTISQVSPSSIPPGAAITVTGTGFTAASRVGCPSLVPTTYVDAATLTATVPDDLAGADGTSVQVAVFVMDGADVSNAVLVTVVFPRVRQQGWTTVEAVMGEVPGFQPDSDITAVKIAEWVRSVAATIAAVMTKRGYSLDPADWPVAAAAETAMPAPSEVLGQINRLGAAARLAAAVAARFGNAEMALTKGLRTDYERELKMLADGGYDNLFVAGASTETTGPLFRGGDMTDDDGNVERSFTKGKVF